MNVKLILDIKPNVVSAQLIFHFMKLMTTLQSYMEMEMVEI